MVEFTRFAALTACLAIAAMGTQARAQNNVGPPPGAILDLNANSIPHAAPVQFSVTFTATAANTAISFWFRDDPAYLEFSDPSVTDMTTGSTTNLLGDAAFTAGTAAIGGNASVPIGWTFSNPNSALAYGAVATGCGAIAGSNCWIDGATQAYDELSQTIATVIGQVYKETFYLTETGTQAQFSSLSTNGKTGSGGNGVDVASYATPIHTPEPSSWLVFGSGLAFLLAMRARDARRPRPGTLLSCDFRTD